MTQKRRDTKATAQQAEQVTIGETGPGLVVEQAAPVKRSDDGRPACSVDGCRVPEFMDKVGLCGAHWATRADLRKEARRG